MRALLFNTLFSAAVPLLAAVPASAQAGITDTSLRFDPRNWGGGPPSTIHYDSSIVHVGRVSARLERDANSTGGATSITRRLPLDFAGRTIELRGFLRTEGVTGFAGLWLREDGPNGALQFDNMQNRALAGTTNWTEYTIQLPLDTNARDLVLGVLLQGQGKVWADGLQLLVDGKPMSQAPRRPRPTTVLDTDQEFATGSGVSVASLSPAQTENLAVLGMVWGFLKYHHPAVAEGKVHWDFELFRVLPAVLAARDRAARNQAITAWVDKLGAPAACTRCATVPEDAALRLDLSWIRDRTVLGDELSRRLQAIHANRFSGGEQFYVTQVRGIQNPSFARELAYQGMRLPDAGYRMLAVFRFWNIIEYWFPYRDIVGEDWRRALREVLPRVVTASTADAYRLEMMALIARVHDTHANLWSDLDVRPPRGTCAWPVTVRFVENRPTVTAFKASATGGGAPFEIGDVIEAISGARVDSLVASWLPYYAASNRPTQLRDVARALPRGECGTGAVTVGRRGRSLTLDVARVSMGQPAPMTQDRAGETLQLLSPHVAYLKLSSVRVADVAGYISRAAGTRGLIIDIRNYPSEFVVFALGSRLVREPTPFARFTAGDLANPGLFTWTQPVVIQPQDSPYPGKIVILVDEVSQSQAEYTTMAFRAVPGAVVVGSTTAGADGNVSAIPLPGGLRSMISGIGVFYPDKRPTQRVGIIPDLVVTPTLDGIRESRDEVLEEAVRQILGPAADPRLIRTMTARRPGA